MNNRLVLASLTTLSLFAQAPAAPPARAPGQASAAITKALTRMEEAWNAALLKADVTALGQIYAEEYLSIDPEGNVLDRKQDLALVGDDDRLVVDKHLGEQRQQEQHGEDDGRIEAALVRGEVGDAALVERRDRHDQTSRASKSIRGSIHMYIRSDKRLTTMPINENT